MNDSQQRQVTHFYNRVAKILWALLGLLVVLTGLKMIRNHNTAPFFSMMWYGIPIFCLAMTAGICWVASKRQESINYRQSLEVKKRGSRR